MSKNRIIFHNNVTHKKGNYIQGHFHNCMEIVYYTKALGETEISEKKYPFSSNTYSVILPENEHSEFHAEDGSVMFIGIETDESIEEGLYRDDENLSVYKIIKEIIYECTSQKDGFEEMNALKIKELLISNKRNAMPPETKKYNFGFVLNYIEENYQLKVDFRQLASSCGYSYDHFRHIFKETTGKSPLNYLAYVRSEKAAHLLSNSNYSCTEIAYKCGFPDASSFSDTFKKIYGQNPANYRKNVL